MLDTKEQSMSYRKRKLENEKAKGIEVAQKRKKTVRQQIPSELNPQNSEKFQTKGRTSRRRRKETLDSCKVIHGDCEGNIWK